MLESEKKAVSKYTQVLYDKGNELESSGKYEEATRIYNMILELTPDYVGTRCHEGLTL